MYQLVTDGCQIVNCGGWAYVLNGEIKDSGHVWGAGNNRMELTAVVKGLKSLIVPTSVTVFTDSHYVVTNAGRLKRRSGSLIEELHELLNYHDVTFVKVKSGIANDEAHHLAREAAFHAVQLSSHRPFQSSFIQGLTQAP